MRERAGGAALVLLVEDNEVIRRAFGFLLEECGYGVAMAATGTEALEVAAREPPDLVLLDLGLPDMHGLEVVRRLKAAPETRACRVVALTGRALDSDRAACLEAGCCGYFAKPVDTRRLLSEIEEQIGKRE